MSKVAIIRCENYDTEGVFNAVKAATDLLGGMAAFFKPGAGVLIKPNLLSPRLPEEGVDTHPELVRAVVRLVKSAGGKPTIGDSPGGYGQNMEVIFEKSGMRRVAEEEGVELVRFTSSKFVDGIPISRRVFDADCMISVPKIKTHGVTVLTAAIKNMYGTVTGLYKTEGHLKAPKEKEFAKIIAKIYSISKPHLTIADGIVAMEGDGPASGTLRNMNFVMASPDGVAMDSCIAKIIGLKPQDIMVTKEAYSMGLGEADLSKIEVLGDDINGFIVRDFKLPQTWLLRFIPHQLATGAAAFIKLRPYIDEKICRKCNLCKITCPVNCITIKDDLCSIDYSRCVRCLCCQEVCPYNAITIRRNILAKMVWR